MRLAPRICAQCRTDFTESYSVRILFALARVHMGQLTRSILFPVKNLLANYFSERQSMEQNVIGRGGFYFLFFFSTINASRIESIGYRDFSQNWLKSMFDDTCVKCNVCRTWRCNRADFKAEIIASQK